MGFDPNRLTSPGVEFGPYPPVPLGVYALLGIEVKTINDRRLDMEREHQLNCTIAAIECAWDEERISSAEADERLLAIADSLEA